MNRSPLVTLGVVVVALGATAALVAGCGSGDDGLDLAEADGVIGAVGGDPAAEAGGSSGDDPDGTGATTSKEQIRPVVEIPPEWPSEIEEVYGRYRLYWKAFAAAHGPPVADPAYEPLAELSTPTNWASLQDQLRSFADDRLVLELPDGSISEHLLRLPDAAVLSGAEGEEVVLQDCWIDDFVQRTIDGTMVSQANEAKLMNVVMRVVDGEWRVDGVTRASSESDGVKQCAELIR